MKEGKLNDVVINGIRTDLVTHAADLGAHTRNPRQELKTGEYYTGCPVEVWVTSQFAANRLYGLPFHVARDATYDRITINVTTVNSGQNIRLGIYELGTDLYPGALVLDAGTVDVSGTGVEAITISQALTKGLYFVAAVADAGTPVIKGYYPGKSPMGDCRSALDAVPNACWDVAFSYAALPDPFTTGGATSTLAFAIFLRLASLD